MTHETAQQRYRRMQRNHKRAMQIAPSLAIPPASCTCEHPRLVHEHDPNVTGDRCVHDGRCLAKDCDCTEYREVKE